MNDIVSHKFTDLLGLRSVHEMNLRGVPTPEKCRAFIVVGPELFGPTWFVQPHPLYNSRRIPLLLNVDNKTPRERYEKLYGHTFAVLNKQSIAFYISSKEEDVLQLVVRYSETITRLGSQVRTVGKMKRKKGVRR